MKKKKEELPKKDDVATDADTEKKEGSDDKEKLKETVSCIFKLGTLIEIPFSK